jgi:hypothetical protein
MGNLTLSIPDDLLKELKKYSYIKWSEVARNSLKEKIKDLERLELYKDLENADKNYKDGKSITSN